MTRVVHFEINADDPAGLVDFDKEVFGWEIMKW
jgi:predicted enzyme related to lactoylglutathione lyase